MSEKIKQHRRPHTVITSAANQQQQTRQVQYQLGYLRDTPDLRDFSISHCKESDLAVLRALSRQQAEHILSDTSPLPDKIDLTETGHFTPIEDQRKLGSCTANAVIGIVEYLLKRTNNTDKDFSRLFLYKTTRNLMGADGLGDTGATIRMTIKALKLFGVVPSEWWPYVEEDFDDEPDAFLYAMAQNFQAIRYFRLDMPANTPGQTLTHLKRVLAGGLPVAFGLWVVPSIFAVDNNDPHIPMPVEGEKITGGHAVLAVGYDEQKRAIKIRNSWGANWGELGHGWLPYDYVVSGLAMDFWTILAQEG